MHGKSWYLLDKGQKKIPWRQEMGMQIVSKWIPEENEIPGIIFRKFIPKKASQKNPSEILSRRKWKDIPVNPKVSASKRDEQTVLVNLNQGENKQRICWNIMVELVHRCQWQNFVRGFACAQIDKILSGVDKKMSSRISNFKNPSNKFKMTNGKNMLTREF